MYQIEEDYAKMTVIKMSYVRVRIVLLADNIDDPYANMELVFLADLCTNVELKDADLVREDQIATYVRALCEYNYPNINFNLWPFSTIDWYSASFMISTGKVTINTIDFYVFR